MANKSGNGIGGLSVAVAAVATANAAAAQARNEAIEQINARLAELNTERDSLVGQLRELGVEQKGRRSGTRAAGAKRASNDESLDVVVAQVLAGAKGPMGPSEVCTGVNKLGWTSESPNFKTMVSQALSRLARTQVGNKMVASNPNRGEWVAGSATAIKAYIADPEKGVLVDENGKPVA